MTIHSEYRCIGCGKPIGLRRAYCDTCRKPVQMAPQSADQIRQRQYECFIEDHEPKPWTPGQCAGYAGRGSHLFRCKRKSGHGLEGLFCAQHAKTGGY